MHTTRITHRIVALFATFVVLTAHAAWAWEGPSASPEKEKELIAILRSDGPASEKAIACKHLAVYGSSEAVADLAKLLSNEQLSSWARIALEAIPGPAADEVLRKSAESLQGKLLVGTINSIGVRRDAKAVESLAGRLNDKDIEVASAAAVALGRIGDAAATKALRGSLNIAAAKVRSAVAEGCVLCAERCLAEGREADAAAIYDEVRKAEVPKQRILEATRGAILSRKQDGIPLLVEQLKSSDNALFRIALATAREFPGKQVDVALAAEIGNAKPERASLIIVAMADRKGTVILPAVLKAAGSGPKEVRIAAIEALGRVGDASCLSSLVQIAQESDAEVVKSAKTALADLPGENVDKEIVTRLLKAEGSAYPMLIELVGLRRIDAVTALLKAVDHSDKTVRQAALTSLGATVPPKRLNVLVEQVVAPKHADDAQTAEQALMVACVRMPDREACAAELSAAMERAPLAKKIVLLQVLGAVGGTKALNTLGTAAKTTNAQLQDTSTRLLGEWMTIDAAPVLLDLSKTAPGDKYQVRALRGYIRIARQFVMPEAQRAQMCEKAFEASRHPAEQKLVLEVLKRYATLEMLALATKASQIPDLKDDATQVSLQIAQKFGGKGVDPKELLARLGVDKVKLEIVKAEYGSGSTQKDVTETLKKLASDSPLITLSQPNYNASFGGDPAPGTVKLLKVQYRINGKPSEASFAENAIIILPMPK